MSPPGWHKRRNGALRHRYLTGEAATSAAARQSATGEPFRAFQCSKCQGWHTAPVRRFLTAET